MTSQEINKAILKMENAFLGLSEAEQDEQGPPQLKGSGKTVPYYGWFWRTVDFDACITLACAKDSGVKSHPLVVEILGDDDVPTWVGFCESNKWGYPERRLSLEASKRVRDAAEAMAQAPSRETVQALFDRVQKEWVDWKAAP